MTGHQLSSFAGDFEKEVTDRQLDDVLKVLYSISEENVHPEMKIEAMMYAYFFMHNQDYFEGGRLDRIVSLDEGHFAHLLIRSLEHLYPDQNYGEDEWAHMYVPRIFLSARYFVNLVHAEFKTHV